MGLSLLCSKTQPSQADVWDSYTLLTGARDYTPQLMEGAFVLFSETAL